jgi:hypothetical protein
MTLSIGTATAASDAVGSSVSSYGTLRVMTVPPARVGMSKSPSVCSSATPQGWKYSPTDAIAVNPEALEHENGIAGAREGGGERVAGNAPTDDDQVEHVSRRIHHGNGSNKSRGREVERPLQLVEVGVVMSGQITLEIEDGQPTSPGMDPASTPLLRGKCGEMGEGLFATPAERREGIANVVAQILPVLGPSLGCGGLPVGFQIQHSGSHSGRGKHRLAVMHRGREEIGVEELGLPST